MASDDEPVRATAANYSARADYADYSVGAQYEQVRFSGLLGRYRRRRETTAVKRLLEEIPNGISILDCPCGTGRWWPLLATKAREITAIDNSPGMLQHAAERARSMTIPVKVSAGDAERIALPAKAVDYAFSFALMKHLPRPIQYKALGELARVSRIGVICTFGVFDHISYEFWRRRRMSESYPLIVEELEWMADQAGLLVERMIRCTTPIGVERVIRFAHRS